MAEATLIARIKAQGGKAAKAAFDGLVKALRLLRAAANQAATPLKKVATAGQAASKGLRAAATAATAAKNALGKLAQTKAGAALTKVANASKRVTGGLGRMADAVNDLNKKLRALGREAGKTIAKLKSAGGAARTAGTKIKAAGTKVKGFSQSILDGGGVLGKFRSVLLDAFLISGVVRGFIQGITRAVKALAGLVAEAQKTNIALTAAEIKLKASTDGAEQLIEANLRLAEVTKRFGVELTASKESLAEFLAATRSSNLGFQERLGLFESLIQVGRTFNLSSERIKLSFLALTQVASKGAAALEEIRRQLGDQIPGIVPLLAEKLGITVPKLFERLRAKAVSSEEAIRGLRDAFNDLSDEQAVIAGQTLAASIGRLGREVDLVKLAFAEASEEGVQRFIDETGRLVAASTVTAQALGGQLQDEALSVLSIFTELAANAALVKERFTGAEPAVSDLGLAFDALLPGMRQAAIAAALINVKLRPLAERARIAGLNELADAFDEIARSAEAGGEQLSLAFAKQVDGQKRAADSIRRITRALRDDTISRVEAERLLSSIVITETDKQRIALQKLRREHQERRDETERQIDAERRLAKETAAAAEDRAGAERQIQDAIETTTELAESQAQLRVSIGADLVKRLVEFEVQLTDDIAGELRERTSQVRLGADERAEIERQLTEKLSNLRDKLNEKLVAIREEALAKLREEGSDQEAILEEQLDKELKARRRANEAAGKLLEDFTDRVEKEAQKQASAVEKAAKKAGDSWREAFEDIGADVGGGEVDFGTGRAAEETVFFGEALDAATTKLEKLKKEASEGLFAGKDTFALNRQIVELENNLTRIAQQGVPTFRESFVSAVGAVTASGQQLLDRIEQITTGNAKWTQDYDELGRAGQENVDRIIATYQSLAENTRITRSDTEEFGRQLDEAFAKGGQASEDLASKLGGATEAAQEAGGAQVELSRDVETGRLQMESLGEAATAAAAAEKDLGDKAAEVAEKAKIPEEVIQSIEQLGATAETVAPLLDPLVGPLGLIAEAITNLSTAITVLPEPLAQVSETLLLLAEKEILGPLAEGLEALVAQFDPLSQSLPPTAEALQGFVDAATGSEEPVASLAKALEAITKGGILEGLETLTTRLDAVSAALVALAEGGFAKAQEGADSFEEALFGADGLMPQMEEFAKFLGETFQQALSQHAVEWEDPVLAAQKYREELRDQIDSLFPEWSAAASAMFDGPLGQAQEFLSMLQQISQELAALEQKGGDVLGGGGGGGVPTQLAGPRGALPLPGG